MVLHRISVKSGDIHGVDIRMERFETVPYKVDPIF